MQSLREMGFVDPVVNMNVLKRVNGSLEAALQLLVGEGNIGQSVF